MMDLRKRLELLGERFKGRINGVWYESMLMYLQQNEPAQFLVELCEVLCDGEGKITKEEYTDIYSLNAEMGFPVGEKTMKYLLQEKCDEAR